MSSLTEDASIHCISSQSTTHEVNYQELQCLKACTVEGD